MLAGFAPNSEMLTVVEQQVVALLANAAHGPAQGLAAGISFVVADHPRSFTQAKLLEGAAQNLFPFEVVGHAAIAKIDAVVHEQPVAPRHLQVVGRGHGVRRSAAPGCWGEAPPCCRGTLPPASR